MVFQILVKTHKAECIKGNEFLGVACLFRDLDSDWVETSLVTAATRDRFPVSPVQGRWFPTGIPVFSTTLDHRTQISAPSRTRL